MGIITACGLVICACAAVKLIGRDNPDMRVLVSLSVIIITAAGFIESYSGVTAKLQKLFSLADIDPDYVLILMKALGICIVSQLSADCCRDCGESALASQIEIIARISLLVISLPLYETVTELCLSLIGS